MPHPFVIRSRAQLAEITSPIRGEILDVVDLMGPLSIAEIAAVMGRPADTLYYHVRRLVRIGLLAEVTRRKARRQQEAVFDLPGRPMFVEYSPSDAAFVRILVRSISAMLRTADRDFKAAFKRRLVRETRQARNVIHARALGWFTDEEIFKMREEIRSVIARFRSSSQRREKASHLYALTTILAPLEERRR